MLSSPGGVGGCQNATRLHLNASPTSTEFRIVLQGMDGGGMLRSHVNSPQPLQCNQGASQCRCLPAVQEIIVRSKRRRFVASLCCCEQVQNGIPKKIQKQSDVTRAVPAMKPMSP